MNYYENIVIIDAALDEENVDSAIKRISDTIEGNTGQILKQEKWGRRKLAYVINKHEKGFYLFFVFKAPPTTVKLLEVLYKVYDPVFKYQVIRLGKKEITVLEDSLRAAEAKQKEAAEAVPVEEEKTEG
ncbi:MAG: 30S ribosomal protein S6 [Nitrospirae bacterium]|nr:30S ribosomal protein S6 [Nitrospirota bacterium]MBF0592425.1 30S ribosomal protein S6 [Nitrospirota bacterium]